MAHKVTDIEELMAKLLKEMNLKFKREFYVGNYPVDFYLPDYKLSVQTDGCWVHGHKGCTKIASKKYPRQGFQRRRDRACMAYHRYSKVSILRVKECTLKGNLKLVHDTIVESLTKILNGKLVYKSI